MSEHPFVTDHPKAAVALVAAVVLGFLALVAAVVYSIVDLYRTERHELELLFLGGVILFASTTVAVLSRKR